MELVNRTALAVDRSLYLDARGAERMVFAAKATFTIGAKGALRLCDEQQPLSLVETFYGDPGVSSVRAEAEVGPAKPATDCILRGHALTPTGRERLVRVRFAVGSAALDAVVFGARHWVGRGERAPSEPAAFERLPLRWEHAFGGADDSPDDRAHHAWEPRNPVGVGLFARDTRRDLDAAPLPGIEDPGAPIATPESRPSPVGFGFVARHWQPRVAFAGTYDAAWLRDRRPLLPDDFDPRFHQAAPPALVARRCVGGEAVRVEGVTRAGPLGFALPRPRVAATVVLDDREERVLLALDTVLVDADLMQLTLLLKAEIALHGRLDDVTATLFDGAVAL